MNIQNWFICFTASALIASACFGMETEHPQLTKKEKRFLVTRCAQRLHNHTDVVTSVACRPDGKQIASGSLDKTVSLCNPNDHNPLWKTLRDHTNGVKSVAYNPQGTQLASGSLTDELHGIIMIHDSQENNLLHTIHEKSWIQAITYNYDGSQIASISHPGPCVIKIWDVQQADCVKTLNGHENSIRCIASHPHEPQIATGSDDTTAKLWDTRTDTCSATLEGDKYPVCALTYNPSGTELVTTSINGLVNLWDLRTNKPLSTLRLWRNYINSVAFNPSNPNEIALGLDTAIRLQNPYNEASYSFLSIGDFHDVNSITYSPDGTQLVSGVGSLMFPTNQSPVIMYNLELVKKVATDSFNSKQIKMLQKYTKSIYSLSFSEIDQLTAMGFDVTLRPSDMIY